MKYHTSSLALLCLLLLIGCSAGTKKSNVPPKTSGSRSAVFAIDTLIASSTKQQMSRHAALLGIFVAEYISFAETALASQGALTGIAIDQQIVNKRNTITDPDFELLQAFADALQVDVADLLNRSTDRQQSLDAYTTSLTNVGSRANGRYQELSRTVDDLKAMLRTQGKERSDAERALASAIKKKDFSEAGELQKTVLEKQTAYAGTDLKNKQAQDIASTLNSLLKLYQLKILAIQKNREILIAGNHIVDVPGIEELKIIERTKSSRTSGRGADEFNSLFEGTILK